MGTLGATGALMAGRTAAAAESAGARTDTRFNVRDFGAVGDGKTSDSAAIQKAIDAAGERSCQMRLENVHGLAMTGNTCLAGRDDGGKGLFTPQVGFIVKGLSHSVIANNSLWHGYMQDKVVDLGGHGDEFVMKDNVGCPMASDK